MQATTAPTTRIVTAPAIADAWAARAAETRAAVAQRTLPFWYEGAYRASPTGYRLGRDAVRGRFETDGQLLVSQARLVWSFSRAHRLGYSTNARDYLGAASHGFAHLQGAFRDATHGGYRWRVRQGGRPSDETKVMYGNAFALYAIVEFAVAADDASALDEAMKLFGVLNDGIDGKPPLALAEVSARDFDPRIELPDGFSGVAMPGYRCANTVLHWMEALIELYRHKRDAGVRRALLAALELNASAFYPPELAKGVYFHPASAAAPKWPKPADASYGHNVEFGWLMIEAQRVLGLPPDWGRLESIVCHAFDHGYDHDRGGLYNAGRGDAPAHDRRKVWWSQAEMIAALTYLIDSGEASRPYERELAQLLDWYEDKQIDAGTGTPYAELSAEGKVTDATLSGEWQAAYHDLRARWIFIDAFVKRT